MLSREDLINKYGNNLKAIKKIEKKIKRRARRGHKSYSYDCSGLLNTQLSRTEASEIEDYFSSLGYWVDIYVSRFNVDWVKEIQINW